ncbi:MAG: tetratricopeptide repeat protein [Planctomycetes bacterium]|nr:tetratricopeptide repeat protein [Planctomycetota bacterium]
MNHLDDAPPTAGNATALPQSPRLLAETGYLALYDGHVDEARTIFEGLERLVPDDVLPKLGLAECALAASDLEGAMRFAKAAARVPSCDQSALLFAYWLQAKAALRAGDASGARELARRMLDLDPDGPWSASLRTLLEAY